jgi:hypothetical protein
MYLSTRDATLGGIHIYDRFGTPLPGWPQLLGEEFWSTPAVGDLDKDGVPEIAISDLNQRTWVFHANGAVASGWPQQTAWATYHSTVIADVNGDRAPDVLATAANGYMGGGVYAWTGSGTTIPGFPLYTDVDAQAGPTVADIDNDGKVEVVASSNWDFDQTKGVEKFRGSLYVWDLAGTYRGSASPWPHFHHDASHAGRFEGRCLAVSLSPAERAANQLPATRIFTLTLTNIDGARCGSRGWPLSASVPSGWSANFSTANPTVPPGSTVEVTLTVTAPAGTAEGSYPVRVTVAGDATHQPIEKSAVFLLDVTAPTVIITKPASGASYPQNSVVYASYSCSDVHIQSCIGTVAAGSRIPTATTGTKSFTVTATDRAGNVGSKTVSYTVAGGNLSYTLSPTSLTFGKRPLNTTSSAKAITLNSTGSAALPITSISLSGTNPAQFTQTNNCGSSVPAGSRCTIWVRFKPTSAGAKTASLQVTAGGGAGTKTVSLSGTGVRSTLSVSPIALAFGDVPRNVTSAAKTVTISNTGTVVLPINQITLEGNNPGQFAKTSNCPAQVPVGNSCTVSVVFKPTFVGVKSANLKVTPGGGASAKFVALSGTGI